MIKEKEKVFNFIWMEASIQDNGRMIKKKERVF